MKATKLIHVHVYGENHPTDDDDTKADYYVFTTEDESYGQIANHNEILRLILSEGYQALSRRFGPSTNTVTSLWAATEPTWTDSEFVYEVYLNKTIYPLSVPLEMQHEIPNPLELGFNGEQREYTNLVRVIPHDDAVSHWQLATDDGWYINAQDYQIAHLLVWVAGAIPDEIQQPDGMDETLEIYHLPIDMVPYSFDQKDDIDAWRYSLIWPMRSNIERITL